MTHAEENPSHSSPALPALGLSAGSALSETMQTVIGAMRMTGGTISRFPGGFWRVNAAAQTWWGTTTIQALVKRGVIEYCEHQQRKSGGSFPIKARLLPNNGDVGCAGEARPPHTQP